MYYTRPHLRATVSAVNPRCLAVCDRCGFVYNHQDLDWQYSWGGARLRNDKILVCESCYDKHQEQLRTIIIPADPVPIYVPRQEQYFPEVTSNLGFTDEFGNPLITEIEDTLSPDPNDPVI